MRILSDPISRAAFKRLPRRVTSPAVLRLGTVRTETPARFSGLIFLAASAEAKRPNDKHAECALS